MMRLPRRFIVPLPAAASRSPCGGHCAIGSAEPRYPPSIGVTQLALLRARCSRGARMVMDPADGGEDLKTAEAARLPWVRIPPPPHFVGVLARFVHERAEEPGLIQP